LLRRILKLTLLRLYRRIGPQFSSINNKKAAVLECIRSAATRHGALILNDNLASLTALDAYALSNYFRHFSVPMFGYAAYCRSNTRRIMST
jgi:hypothetical protein